MYIHLPKKNWMKLLNQRRHHKLAIGNVDRSNQTNEQQWFQLLDESECSRTNAHIMEATRFTNEQLATNNWMNLTTKSMCKTATERGSERRCSATWSREDAIAPWMVAVRKGCRLIFAILKLHSSKWMAGGHDNLFTHTVPTHSQWPLKGFWTNTRNRTKNGERANNKNNELRSDATE